MSQLHDPASVLMSKLTVSSVGMSVSTFFLVIHDFPTSISTDSVGLVLIGCLFLFGLATGYLTKKLVEQKSHISDSRED
jgi:hypothetical protein